MRFFTFCLVCRRLRIILLRPSILLRWEATSNHIEAHLHCHSTAFQCSHNFLVEAIEDAEPLFTWGLVTPSLLFMVVVCYKLRIYLPRNAIQFLYPHLYPSLTPSIYLFLFMLTKEKKDIIWTLTFDIIIWINEQFFPPIDKKALRQSSKVN